MSTLTCHQQYVTSPWVSQISSLTFSFFICKMIKRFLDSFSASYSGFTISFTFKNYARQESFQINLLWILTCGNLQFFLLLLFQGSSCSKVHEAFYHWTCEGVVSLISHVSFFSLLMISTGLLLSCALWISTFTEK